MQGPRGSGVSQAAGHLRTEASGEKRAHAVINSENL